MAGFYFPWSRFPQAGDHRRARAPQPRRRLFWITIGFLVLLGTPATWLGLRFTHRWAERSRWEAQEELRQQDYAAIEQTLEKAVRSNPGNREARRELAQYYQDAGSVRAQAAWHDLFQLDPVEDRDRLDFGRGGLILGDLAAARGALAEVSAEGRAGLPFHRLQAALALKNGDRVGFAAEVAIMERLDPDPVAAKFNRASIALTCGDAASAEPILEPLARDGPFRIRATLELIQAAAREGTPAAYTELADRLLLRPHRMALLAWGEAPRGLFELIGHMEAQPSPSPEDAALLARWLIRQGYASDAVFWLSTLEEPLQRAPELLAVRATALARTRDWSELEACLRLGAWGKISGDALTLAFAARAQRERLHEEHERTTWADALLVASASPDGLRVLLHLAEEFGWPDETGAARRGLAASASRGG